MVNPAELIADVAADIAMDIIKELDPVGSVLKPIYDPVVKAGVTLGRDIWADTKMWFTPGWKDQVPTKLQITGAKRIIRASAKPMRGYPRLKMRATTAKRKYKRRYKRRRKYKRKAPRRRYRRRYRR